MGYEGKCVFPFTYNKVTYISCAHPSEYGGVGWCAWDHDFIGDRWGYCSATCPLGRLHIFGLTGASIQIFSHVEHTFQLSHTSFFIKII